MLTSLLRGGHLDVPESIKRGLWSHPPIELSAVVGHLAKTLQSEKWFSRDGSLLFLGSWFERAASSSASLHHITSIGRKDLNLLIPTCLPNKRRKYSPRRRMRRTII